MSGVATTLEPKKRHRSRLGWVLLLISLALFGLAAFHIVRMITRGYDYACTNGDGCSYNAPDISNDASWVSATITFAIIALALSIVAFTFHRIRSAFGSAGSPWALTGFGSLPLIARTLSAAYSRMGATHVNWQGMVWPGMSFPGGSIPGLAPGVTLPGMEVPMPTGVPGAPEPAATGTLGTAGSVPPVADSGNVATTDPNRAATIEATGLDGEAVIAGMHDVGMANGTNRMYELDLAVTLPGTATYHVKHMAWVPVASVGRLYAGGRLRAKIDPADHNSLVLDMATPPN